MQVAFRISDLRVDFRPAFLVTQRKEPEENQREDVALVVRRLDVPTQRHRGVPKLLEKFRDTAISVLPLVECFFHLSKGYGYAEIGRNQSGYWGAMPMNADGESEVNARRCSFTRKRPPTGKTRRSAARKSAREPEGGG